MSLFNQDGNEQGIRNLIFMERLRYDNQKSSKI